MPCRSSLAILLILVVSGTTVRAEPVSRYVARLQDGTRITGNSLSDWYKSDGRPKLDGQPLLDEANPMSWLVDRSLTLPTEPNAFIETITGDRLPGVVTGYRSEGNSPYDRIPSHFLVETAAITRAAGSRGPVLARVDRRFMRRIVWDNRHSRDFHSNTIYLKDGAELTYRVARFSDGFITLLLEDGQRRIPFRDIAELHFEAHDAWDAYLNELVVLTPNAQGRLIQLETVDGLVVTASLSRFLARAAGDPKDIARWLHGVQPIWSLDVLWATNARIRTRRLCAANEVPLTRLNPTGVQQTSEIGGTAWPTRRNASVRGRPLRTGGQEFGWGYGVHADCKLEFALPTIATAFSCGVGIDSQVRDGGCMRPAIYLDAVPESPLFVGPILSGSSRHVETGWVPLKIPDDGRHHHLVLHADDAHAMRPQGADPFDIRDLTDWVDPQLQLDAGQLESELVRRSPRQIAAWDGWDVAPSNAEIRFENIVTLRDGGERQFDLAMVSGSQSVTLSRRAKIGPLDRWLVVDVARGGKPEQPPAIHVSIDGQPAMVSQVPLRDGSPRRPIIVPLDRLHGESPRGESLRDVEIELKLQPGTEDVPLIWTSINVAEQHPALYRLFEDELNTLRNAPDLSKHLCVTDHHSGNSSLRLATTPDDRHTGAEPNGKPVPKPVSDHELTLQAKRPIAIRERPQPGEYRFLRYAFRKVGPGTARLSLNRSDDVETYSAYIAGPSETDDPHVRRVWAQQLPDEWIVITRDLYGDFGACTIDSVAFGGDGGEATLFDHLYFAQSQKDFELISTLP